jgi:hypothetical protein
MHPNLATKLGNVSIILALLNFLNLTSFRKALFGQTASRFASPVVGPVIQNFPNQTSFRQALLGQIACGLRLLCPTPNDRSESDLSLIGQIEKSADRPTVTASGTSFFRRIMCSTFRRIDHRVNSVQLRRNNILAKIRTNTYSFY